jgi:hypothetical protein
MYIRGFHLVELHCYIILLMYEILMFVSVSSGLCSCVVGVLCTVQGSLPKHVRGKIVCIFFYALYVQVVDFLIKRTIICCMVSKITKVLIMTYFPLSFNFLSFTPRYSKHHPFLNTFHLWSSLSVGHQVPATQKYRWNRSFQHMLFCMLFIRWWKQNFLKCMVALLDQI